MKLSDLPQSRVKDDILEALPGHQYSFEFTTEELFDTYLEYNGIIGYTSSITEAYRQTHREVFVVTHLSPSLERSLVGHFYSRERAREAIRAHGEPQHCKIETFPIEG